MAFKTPLKVRQQHMLYKRNNWAAYCKYQREYMRTYRVKPPGQKIVADAQKRYYQKNKQAFAMYAAFVKLLKAGK